MGSQIGRYSYIHDICDGVITIGVINSAWMSQLFIYKRQIKEKINSYLGERYVKDIKFTGSGKVPPKKVSYGMKSMKDNFKLIFLQLSLLRIQLRRFIMK